MLLVAISAPAGTGKTTLVNALKEQHCFVHKTISCTSRSPRSNESEGIDYFFVTKDRFKKDIELGRFVEWNELYGEYYGTLISQFEKLNCADHCAILVIDIEGAMNLQRRFPCVTIFVLPPTMGELRRRLLMRGTDSTEKIEQRMSRAEYEIKHAPFFDYQVINGNFDTALAELEHIISFERFQRNNTRAELA